MISCTSSYIQNCTLSSGTLLFQRPVLEWDEDLEVKVLLHPAFDRQFKACKTPTGPSSFWLAACMSFGLHESKADVLREYTAATIRKHSEHFQKLLKDTGSSQTIESLLNWCQNLKEPATIFHMLALSICFKRNIFVYRSFIDVKSCAYYRQGDRDIKSLAQSFQTWGANVGEHFQFQPQKDTYSRLWPICLFFLEDAGNYVALKPRTRCGTNLYCVPQLVVLESIATNEGVEPRRGCNSNLSHLGKRVLKTKRLEHTKTNSVKSVEKVGQCTEGQPSPKGSGSRWSYRPWLHMMTAQVTWEGWLQLTKRVGCNLFIGLVPL